MGAIYKNVKGEDIAQWEIDAMDKVLRYAANFEPNFISLAGITPLCHMQRKFSNLYDIKNPTASFLKFYFECDAENQSNLLIYINNR